MERLLKKIGYDRRLDVLEMVKKAGTGHVGGSMSCMDILVSLYYGMMDIDKIRSGAADRDRFIFSKGHCAEALYAVLADKELFPKEMLKTYAVFNTLLAEHPTPKVPGVEIGTGALGHGLSVGAGMAFGLKADKNPAIVYILMGDGEQAEGSVWEAAMFAGKYKLDNLVAIIDRNRMQISGYTEDVMPLNDLKEKYRAFGWECRSCDGHNPISILKTLHSRPLNKPLLVMAETIKGYGSSLMENKADWHHLVPDNKDYIQIKKDLTAARDALPEVK